jgi:signal transduction histidine kinase
VLDRLTPVQREVQTDAGDAWYIVRIRPYRTVDNVIEGVVLTFVDITEQKQTEQALREAKEYAESIVDTVRESLVVLDTELRVQSANASFYDTFEVDPENVEGQRIYDLGNGQWDIPELRTLLEEVLPDNDTFDGFQVTHDFETLGERTLLLNARRLDHVQYILLAIKDITEQEAAKHELRTVNRRLQERVAETRELASELTVAEQREQNRIAQVLHDDLQQLLYAVEGRVNLAAQDLDAEDRPEVAQSIQETREWIGRAIETTRQLTVDLSPPILGDENLADALEWLQNQMDELHGFAVELEGEQTRPFDEEVRTLLFQTVRELLFNAHKHAGVDTATVRLEEPAAADDETAPLLIHVIDEGQGFDVDATEMQATGSMGLHRAHERLRLLGGRLDIQSAPGEGTHITIHAPPREASPQVQT